MTDLKPVSVMVDDVSVSYKVYQDRHFGMRDLVSRGFKNRDSIQIDAVKDVSFQVRIGEALGIIGSNGSGKSTLLRAIAGLQSVQGGTIKVRGEAQLLGVSSVLMRGLSGYRNVMLGGLANGLSRAQIEAEMDNIVEFSGLGDAMSRPMHTYSSGMQARLAFSIATLHVPEILLIDEALAVGDKDFKEKSLQRINEIRSEAGTVVMVSHDLSEIARSCTRAIWLDQGVLRADGPTDDVIAQYSAR